KARAITLVVAKDVEHRLTLVRQLFVRNVEVRHDVDHRATVLVALLEASLEHLDAFAQAGVRTGQVLELRPLALPSRRCDHVLPPPPPPPFIFSSSRLACSSSFSSAIIFSSRPTTTSSNFSRSR